MSSVAWWKKGGAVSHPIAVMLIKEAYLIKQGYSADFLAKLTPMDLGRRYIIMRSLNAGQ